MQINLEQIFKFSLYSRSDASSIHFSNGEREEAKKQHEEEEKKFLWNKKKRRKAKRGKAKKKKKLKTKLSMVLEWRSSFSLLLTHSLSRKRIKIILSTVSFVIPILHSSFFRMIELKSCLAPWLFILLLSFSVSLTHSLVPHPFSMSFPFTRAAEQSSRSFVAYENGRMERKKRTWREKKGKERKKLCMNCQRNIHNIYPLFLWHWSNSC